MKTPILIFRMGKFLENLKSFSMSKDITEIIRNNDGLGFWTKAGIAVRMSLPAMLAQLTTIAMEYIDAAMVGSLGANASASIGLVSSSLWLVEGVIFALIYGFSVQIAHSVGAGDEDHSQRIFRCGLLFTLLFNIVIAFLAFLISGHLPFWLGGDAAIAKDASAYFLVMTMVLPITRIGFYCASCIQSTGNMKTPAILEASMCILDIFFNCFMIFPSGTKTFLGISFYLPGAGLGVAGAAWGTAIAEFIITGIMFYIAVRRTNYIRFKRSTKKTGLTFNIIKKALSLAAPAAAQQIAISGAMVMTTRIIAPLGSVSVAANSFAITAESVCYMPGFGLQGAASTLVGQSLGAEKKTQAKSFAWICTVLGMIIMALLGVIMYFLCPYVFSFLTPDPEVQKLAVTVLRIELLAEPFYGASIVAAGALRGAGDTLVPSILSFVSIWGVRVTLAFLLVGTYGLRGMWIAMAIELTFRGLLFLARLKFGKWQKSLAETPSQV